MFHSLYKSNANKIIYSILLSLTLALFLTPITSCASHPVISEVEDAAQIAKELYLPEKFEWQKVEEGIYRFDFENKVVPVIYHAAKIDLSTKNLEIVCFPNKETVEKEKAKTTRKDNSNLTKVEQPFIFTGIRTSTFAKRFNCLIAINATPFAGRNGKWDLQAKIGNVRQLVGSHVCNGMEISYPKERYAALGLKKSVDENGNFSFNASIIDSQKDSLIEDFDFVFGGFFTVLRGGNKRDFKTITHDSRSGAGISADGKTLYLLVVEGENQFKSIGLSFPQCADIFKAMGCSEALEFDGGSSSQLCIKGKSVLSYKFTVVEGNSFGFRFSD